MNVLIFFIIPVYGVSGRKIKEIESKLNSGTHKFEIDNLKKGSLFLRDKS